MASRRALLACLAVLAALVPPSATASASAPSVKTRIAIVSSYHREYLWSQDTNEGVVAALLARGWLDDPAQGEAFSGDDRVESSRAVIRKLWMDTKRRNGEGEIAESVASTMRALESFDPDVILLGDDNATNHIGNQYVDTDVPVVFWGVNGNPMKYDLIESVQRPGHNVTGVYQAGYLREGLMWLKRVLPGITRLGILSDDSPTGRSKTKELVRLARQGQLPVEIVGTVVTNSLEEWKAGARDLEPKVDVFFVLNHNTLEDADGRAVDQLEIGAWYLRNIRKPDIGQERQFVVEGLLCAVDDSGFKQGFEAVEIAHRILVGGEDPAEIPVYAPSRGPFVVNAERAAMLGLADAFEASGLVEQRVERALALQRHP